MPTPFDVLSTDITHLRDYQVAQLLHRLLLLEATKLGLPKRRVSVALNIDCPDGGQDGKLEWTGDPDPSASDWIPGQHTLFQVKATNMTPGNCYREVQVRKRVKNDEGDGAGDDEPGTGEEISLKPRVADLVDHEGAYVLIYSRECEGDCVTKRITKFREAFSEVVGEAKANRVDIDVYGAEKIAAWTNEHAAAIAFVKRCLGLGMAASLHTWHSWEGLHQSPLAFHADVERRAVIATLTDVLSEPRRVARLVGLSGLGKSRVALELFRPPSAASEDPVRASLSAACVYVDDGAREELALQAAMHQLRHDGTRAVLVVDECPLELHLKLQQIATAANSRISLLTLDYEPGSDPRSPQCRFLKLTPMATEDIVEILQKSHTQVPERHLSRVAEVAQGYPRMAHFMVEAIEGNRENLWECADTVTIERLVVRRSREPSRVLRIARALSIFEHLGVSGVAEGQFEIFARELCNEAPEAVHTVVRELEIAGIAYRRGDYVRLTPLPIAVLLAQQWWNERSLSRSHELLIGGTLTQEMVDATANQLKRLSEDPWVRDLVAAIYGPESPFRQRDLLDSARWSRLASTLAEVNPQAVCSALTSAFSALSPEEARTIHVGRRDLVWCLEKLAWWPDTFDDAAWLLLLFAAGENETWGNNASNQFAGLFHVYLSGTETPAIRRLDIIRRALATRNSEFEPQLVNALSEAFSAGHFSRAGGVEAQGGRLPRKDWVPQTWGEVWEYWRAALELLVPFALRDDELGGKARSGLGNRARGMIRWGAISVVEHAVDRVLVHRAWVEMLDGLRSALNYDGSEYSPELRTRVEALVSRLTPRDLPSRLASTVSTPSWNELRKEENGQVTQVAEERARQLAQEISGNVHALVPHLPALLVGEQRQGYNFGRALSEAVSDPLGLFDLVLSRLGGMDEASRNPVLLMGLADGTHKIEPEALRDRVRRMFSVPATQTLAVQCVLAIGATDEDAITISELLRGGSLPSSAVQGFAFGGSLRPLSPASVAALITACAQADEAGPVIAIDLLGMRMHRGELEEELIEPTRALLSHPNLIPQITSRHGGLVEHHLEQLAGWYLSATRDTRFAASFTEALVESLDSEDGFPARHGVRKLLSLLIERFPNVVWPVLRRSFEADGRQRWLRLELTLEKFDLVNLVGESQLLLWCEENEDARHWLARMIHPLRPEPADPPYPSWSSIALELLDRYGSDEDLLSSLSASIHTGTWAGSAVPRLTRHRNAFVEIRHHRNPVVARWAVESVEGLDKQIERERKRDEEEEFGIFR